MKDPSYWSILRSPATILLLALAMISSETAMTKERSTSIPRNAVEKSYGSGWECVRGYREIDGRCSLIQVPPNAFRPKSSYGPVWECRRGFVERDEKCVAINVPAHGYLVSYGDRWKCHRGYVQVKDDCLPVQVPANGYLADDSYGRGWACERGFAAKDEACIAVDVPKNAHLNYSGTGWECDRSFEPETGSVCRAVTVVTTTDAGRQTVTNLKISMGS